MKADPVFAPLTLAEFTATERYEYRQELSSNPRLDEAGAPTGQLRLAYPLDGAVGCPGAVADRVTSQLAQPGHGGRLLVGHLGLADEGRTDLRTALGELTDSGLQPLTIASAELAPDLRAALTADRQRLEFGTDYVPKSPRVLPIRFQAELFDEEFFSGQGQRLVTRDGFLRCLSLRLVAEVTVARAAVRGEGRPRLRELFIPWPGIPSLRNFRFCELSTGDSRTVRFDPDRRGLVVNDLALAPRQSTGDMQHYATSPLLLMINQPAELSQQAELGLEGTVDFPDCLLSAARLRYFDAAGRGDGPWAHPECETKFTLRARLRLGDLFRDRPRRPWLAIRFERVIPDQERLNNIQDALVDLGFRTLPAAPNGTHGGPPWRFQVERREGPHRLELTVEVAGQRRRIQVEEEQGQRLIRSERDTGDLELLIMADFRGDDTTAGHYLNQLHAELRKRFHSAVTEG
jgi:hypothetical protein